MMNKEPHNSVPPDMIIRVSGMRCRWCKRTYKDRSQLNKHNVTCEPMYRAFAASTSDDVSIRELTDTFVQMDPQRMHNLLLHLAKKVIKLETQVTELRSSGAFRNRRLNYAKWLNRQPPTSHPSVNYTQLINSINAETLPVSDDMITASFCEPLSKIFLKLFDIYTEHTSTSGDRLPCKAFTQHHAAIIYVYTSVDSSAAASGNVWIRATTQIIYKLANKILMRLFDRMCVWRKQQPRTLSAITEAKYDELYARLLSLDDDNGRVLQPIYKALYQHIKQPFADGMPMPAVDDADLVDATDNDNIL